MKKFSLKEYLKNPDRKVMTRDGRPVRIICTDSRSNAGCVIGLVGENDAAYVWDEYGSHKVSENPINDIFFVDKLDVKPVEPEVDLEREVEKYLLNNADFVTKSTSNEIVNALARHFAEWGAEHLKK